MLALPIEVVVIDAMCLDVPAFCLSGRHLCYLQTATTMRNSVRSQRKTNSDMLVGAAEAFLVSHSQLNVINDRICAAGRSFVPVAAILVPSAWPVESVRW
jgi:hypothetical protein